MSLLGVDAALYSILTYVAAAKTLDFVLHGIDEYTAITIMSDVYCVVTRLEIGKVKAIVRDLDERAFVVFHPLAGAEGGMVKTRGFH